SQPCGATQRLRLVTAHAANKGAIAGYAPFNLPILPDFIGQKREPMAAPPQRAERLSSCYLLVLRCRGHVQNIRRFAAWTSAWITRPNITDNDLGRHEPICSTTHRFSCSQSRISAIRVIGVFDSRGTLVETHEQAGDFNAVRARCAWSVFYFELASGRP